MLLIAAFAIYVIVKQRVRITRRFTLTGRNARNYGITVLLCLLPTLLIINAAMAALLPQWILDNPIAVSLVATFAFGGVAVLLARSFRDSADSLAARGHHERRFRCGQPVRISPAYHWAKSATGVIERPPRDVAAIAGDWSECTRQVRAPSSDIQFWWVRFDAPQLDADGDGPYNGAEVDDRYLESAERSDA
jgi:hypothetical protein